MMIRARDDDPSDKVVETVQSLAGDFIWVGTIFMLFGWKGRQRAQVRRLQSIE